MASDVARDVFEVVWDQRSQLTSHRQKIVV